MTKPIRLTHPALCHNRDIQHGFFTRHAGFSKGIYSSLNVGPGSKDNPQSVQKNRLSCLNELSGEIEPDYNPELFTVHQHHSATVVTLEAESTPDACQKIKADGIVTAGLNQAIGILTADCVPVLFADPYARVIGAAHAGWRGAHGGVLQETVRNMQALGSRTEQITALIGPCIGPESYIVGSEFLDRFSDRYVTVQNGPEKPQYLFNLRHYVQDRLLDSGIGTIGTLGHDTLKEEETFFSYRRSLYRSEPDYGRQLSAIMLRPK